MRNPPASSKSRRDYVKISHVVRYNKESPDTFSTLISEPDEDYLNREDFESSDSTKES